MPDGAQVQVQGAAEVRRTLRALGAGTRDMSRVHRKVAAMVIGPAQGVTRRRSGDLAGSYRVKVSASKAQVSSALVYAPVQEFGWPRRNITPSKALTGTVESMAGSIAQVYQAEVDALVDRLNAGGTTP